MASIGQQLRRNPDALALLALWILLALGAPAAHRHFRPVLGPARDRIQRILNMPARSGCAFVRAFAYDLDEGRVRPGF